MSISIGSVRGTPVGVADLSIADAVEMTEAMPAFLLHVANLQ